MSRAPRGPKRSTTPTSATFPSADVPPPASPNPQTNAQKPLYLCSPFVDAALVKGNFKTIVMLPKYVDVMEWVACNSKFGFSLSWALRDACIVFDFYQNLNLFYGVVSECCTQQSCPAMSAGAS